MITLMRRYTKIHQRDRQAELNLLAEAFAHSDADRVADSATFWLERWRGQVHSCLRIPDARLLDLAYPST